MELHSRWSFISSVVSIKVKEKVCALKSLYRRKEKFLGTIHNHDFQFLLARSESICYRHMDHWKKVEKQ